jgi:hypothetical protein
MDIAKYVASCDICQKINDEHQKPAGLLKPLEIPEWKWENIAMGFVVGLAHSPRGTLQEKYKLSSVWIKADDQTKLTKVNLTFISRVRVDES